MFPRGLRQPSGAYKFGLDALLLGAFAARIIANKRHNLARDEPVLCVELGCGCGAATFAFAPLAGESRVVGFDNDVEAVAAAEKNAVSLGLNGKVSFAVADVTDPKTWPQNIRRKARLAFANPPWYEPESGRRPASEKRERAFFGSGILKNFVLAAREFLLFRGFFCVVLPPAATYRFISIAEAAGFGARKLLPTHAFAGAPAKRVLALFQKEAKTDVEWLFPLVLYDGPGKNPRYSAEALDFCPYLRSEAT